MDRVACMNCGIENAKSSLWFVCPKCGFRVCASCLNSHSGRYGNGGYKCSHCIGYLQQKQGW